MPQLTDEEKDLLFDTLNAQTKQLNRLEQGMYGDPQLGIKGLIQDMNFVKSWISAHKLKIAYFTGIFTAIGLAIEKAWEYLINYK